MKFQYSLLFLVIILARCGTPKDMPAREIHFPEPQEKIRFMFYNVENLFDLENDTLINDEDFVAGGSYNWNEYRYREKLRNISKVAINLGEWSIPALIGVCEIENRIVLEDLVNQTSLNKFKYSIVHKDSPDERGIDVALLYRQDIFTPLGFEAINITFPFEPETKTRDILFVTGKIGEDTLHIFINHWPSRRGGEDVSEPKRIFTGEVLRHKVDSLFSLNKNAKIVITGDFNDEPDNKSIMEGLKAQGDSTKLTPPDLYNYMFGFQKKGFGSYKYRENWNMLDQIIISSGLLHSEEKLTTTGNAAHIYQADWLMEEDIRNPGKKPYRTYAGPNYLGGYSDHLPVYLDIWYKK